MLVNPLLIDMLGSPEIFCRPSVVQFFPCLSSKAKSKYFIEFYIMYYEDLVVVQHSEDVNAVRTWGNSIHSRTRTISVGIGRI